MTPRLILTADDFGLAPEVNEAVERAHREGVLTAASLMVGECAADEAARVARRNPGLAVGLHLTLTDGVPVLPAARIPALADRRTGRFRDDMASLGLLLALSREARAELAAEVAAQLDRFRAAGLRPDHVNAHRHFHLHPVIAAALMQAAAGAGVRHIRIPDEPRATVLRADPRSPRLAWRLLGAWSRVLRRRAANWNLRAPDHVLGFAWSGAFTRARLLAAIPCLPPGVTELYFHPASCSGFRGGAPAYRHAEELETLCHPDTRAALSGLVRGGYAAMVG